MTRFRWVLALLGTVAMAGAAVAGDYSEEALRAADPISGEQTWQQYCAFCHTLREGEADISGPNLYRVFRRGVGNKPGFFYSETLENADREWTPEFFARYVQDPAGTLPGNSMPSVAIPQDEIVALVAYVMRASGSVNWDDPGKNTDAAGGPDAGLRESEPGFRSFYMQDIFRPGYTCRAEFVAG